MKDGKQTKRREKLVRTREFSGWIALKTSAGGDNGGQAAGQRWTAAAGRRRRQKHLRNGRAANRLDSDGWTETAEWRLDRGGWTEAGPRRLDRGGERSYRMQIDQCVALSAPGRPGSKSALMEVKPTTSTAPLREGAAVLRRLSLS
ncbi:hypothetical protein PIB30_048606 [Stylosanthes scabra]|uniref:Uncharacterized protein n=1 Tax=Stylosanthes scabra TaxID=79078 RepID=A0ABU6QGT0_9FABA|nr:hypothetical protein [Stylosanthes scabra]